MKSITKIAHRMSRHLRMALVAAVVSATTVSEAALLSLSDTPLFLTTAVEPNVLLTFDDSGSMAWAYLPDTISGLSNTNRGCSSQINKVYFDPTITYDPPVKADGTPLNSTATSFGAAYINGFNPGGTYTRPDGTTGSTVDLSANYRPSWGNLTSYASCNTAGVPGAAFYYQFTGTDPSNDAHYTLVRPIPAAQQANFANWYSYYRNRNLMAKTATGLAFSLFKTNVRVSGQHLNNGTAGTGAGIRFTNNAADILLRRFCDDPSNNDPLCTNGSTARTDFYTRLYNSPASGGTPLRAAMRRAGDHFGSGNTASNSPYRDTPGAGTTNNPERSCRQNFHVLMTDGYWNSDSGVVGNLDGTTQTLGDASTPYPVPRTPYSGNPPYSDSWSGTLADNSFNYWYRDLRSDLTNNVPKRCPKINTLPSSTQEPCDPPDNFWDPANDPTNWQHLVTFTIGLGIDGTLPNTPTTYDNLVAGTQAWPDPISNTAGERIDDLWHAALNSRGQYFSATNSTALVSAFTSIINAISATTSASSAVALNSGSLSSNSYVYQSRFDPRDWSGHLLSYAISPTDGSIATTATRDAALELSTNQHFDSGRQIITYKPSTGAGAAFRWSALDTAQQAELNKHPLTLALDSNGAARLDYLRGDASNEGTASSNFRKRNRKCGTVSSNTDCPAGTNTGVLGDIIHSAPIYVGKPPFNYPASLETVAYSTFQAGSASSRDPMIYVGANDGMLHAFDAVTGREKFAYVPSEVYRNLSQLTGNPYTHRSFVDGSPVVADVFIGGAWRTILVGGLRYGGQGIFALDITDPGSFTEGNANAISLWEFNDNHDADLGYVYGEPAIAKMNNGQWAVILPGGYNNDQTGDGSQGDGSAALYILFIEDGMDGTWDNVIKIDTGVGDGTIANGLASPAVVDVDGDYKADYIYAGDLRGNMWGFDVTSATESNWNSASNRKVLYVAKDSGGNLQPITSRPQVAPHPAGYAGNFVYFGSGKYLETSDASIAVGATTQTFYAVWDDYTSSSSYGLSRTAGLTSPNRSNLLQQTVTNTVTSGGAEYRAISNNGMVWRIGPPYPSGPNYIGWYLDLPDTGERVAADPLLLDNRIIFTTVVPSDDPCVGAGYGWLMELNAYNGGRLAASPFDVNGDGIFSDADFIPGGSGTDVTAGGKRFNGIPSAPAVLVGGSPAATPGCTGPRCNEQKLISTTVDPTKDENQQTLIHGQENNPQECNYCRASWRQIR